MSLGHDNSQTNQNYDSTKCQTGCQTSSLTGIFDRFVLEFILEGLYFQFKLFNLYKHHEYCLYSIYICILYK